MITFGSLFSGIGGFDLGFERAGMQCLWQCEIDAKAQQVLAQHWPGARMVEDVRNVGRNTVEPVDVIYGGFPCQDLSVAGKRAGLAGERSGLWFEFKRIIGELKPGTVVIEYVPGLLSSNGGADFAVVLSGLVECGYGVAWRILDAQYFGVAQRRRRVFIVGSLGDGRAAEILFEREGVRWDPPARGKAGKGTAGDAAQSIGFLPGQSASARSLGEAEELSPTVKGEGGGAKAHVAYTLKSGGSGGVPSSKGENLVTVDARNMTTGEVGISLQGGAKQGGYSLNQQPLVAFGGNNTSGEIEVATALMSHGSPRQDFESDTFITGTLATNSGPRSHDNGNFSSNQGVDAGFVIPTPIMGVRRLTPTEYARLQGFPDDWNDWLADSSRYKQFGNAVCVNVAEWIGKRIVEATK